MKNICHVLFTTAVLVLVSGCATSPTTAPPATSTSEARSSYDDQKIRNIKKGETSENDLVEWFGPPAAREMKPDGRSFLSWQFEPGAQGQRGGLSVSLGGGRKSRVLLREALNFNEERGRRHSDSFNLSRFSLRHDP